jgi:hypothetical protein
MLKTVSAIFAAAALLTAAGVQAAEQRPNIAGTYRCQTGASNCQWSGNTFTVTQTGNELEVKNDKNEIGHGTVTSNITVSMGPPWNMLGVISNNNRQIEWSNGTLWNKQ